MTKKIEEGSPEWTARASDLAYLHLGIMVCPKCGIPAVDGYPCNWCGYDDGEYEERNYV
jgi:hypothetical protein